jgi:F420-non-reducing hydrogenase iron-sulfur subunit
MACNPLQNLLIYFWIHIHGKAFPMNKEGKPQWSNFVSLLARIVYLIQLPCSAKLGTIHMLRPFEKGVDGVLVMTCSEDGCQSLEGSRRARMRVREANRALDEIGLGCCRVMIKQGGGQDRELYFAAIEELTAQTEKVGPNPIRGNANV